MKLFCDENQNNSSRKLKILGTILLISFSVLFFHALFLKANLIHRISDLKEGSVILKESKEGNFIPLLRNYSKIINEDNLIKADPLILIRLQKFMRLNSIGKDLDKLDQKFMTNTEDLERIIDEMEEAKLNDPHMIEEFYDV